ncbi:outer membrane lipoprotein carrier protein LolA, partial [Agreia sp.]|uniref:LolA family protein n=1 Tax=Agreia sp. TaxID=1872416 RepID=UPI0035BC3E51
MSRTWNRWIPSAAAPVVVGALVLGGVFATSASADPAEKTPQQVLELAASSTVDTFSGTIEQSSDLGLPDVSGLAGPTGSGASDGDEFSSALELLTASHTLRVFVDGPEQSRVQILDDLAERDAIRNGDDLWLYDSSDSSAVHSTLPAGASASPDTTAESLTPAELATRFLDGVDPSTDVTIGDPVTVAGRSAYDLILTPDSASTLVSSVEIAVDAETGLPLRIDVFAQGSSDPAIHVAFSSVSLDTPSADLFDFTPPSGTEVTENTIPNRDDAPADGSALPDGGTHPEPTVTGTGWDTVVEFPAAADPASLTDSPMLSQLTTSVEGG